MLPLLRAEHAAFATGAGCDESCRRRRIHKRSRYVPPIRWYADTALAVGLKIAVPERLRFFIAADDPQAITHFQVPMGSGKGQGWRQGCGCSAHATGAPLCSPDTMSMPAHCSINHSKPCLAWNVLHHFRHLDYSLPCAHVRQLICGSKISLESLRSPFRPAVVRV